MKHITLHYNPFLPELKINIDGEKASRFSTLNRMRGAPLMEWIDSVFPEIYREINTDYAAECVTGSFPAALLREAAAAEGHCRSFHTTPPPFPATVHSRLEELSFLGCTAAASARVPVYNASGDASLAAAAAEILADSGLFQPVEPGSLELYAGALITVQLAFQSSWNHQTGSEPRLILCGTDSDSVPRQNADAVALVMGSRTRFLRRDQTCIWFSVDSDYLADAVLGFLEEIVLCPFLRGARDKFQEAAGAGLPEERRERLSLLCQTKPACTAAFPTRMDRGREELVQIRRLPAASREPVRVSSSSPHIVSVSGLTLCALSPGKSLISVFLGDDPYPFTEREVVVRTRRLIQSISLFPSVLYLPAGGEMAARFSYQPEDAENREEISWRTSDAAVAQVDPATGRITAAAPGRCTLSAATREAKADCSLFVQPPIEDIAVPAYYVEAQAGSVVKWKYEVIPAGAYQADTVLADTSNREVAEYVGGYIRAGKPGECRLIVHTPDNRISREIRVKVKRKGFFR